MDMRVREGWAVEEQNGLLLLALGGLALVCLTGMGGLLLLVLRLARGPIVAFFGLLARNVDEADDPDSITSVPRRPKPNLRAIAQQQDFDALVAARERDQRAAPPGGTGAVITPADRPPSPFGVDRAAPPDTRIGQRDVPPPPFANRDRRPRDERAHREDEIFGGMLDFDGDGRPDV
jgi:hypothetical protein